ncbi:MAG: PIN domain-containing protein [Treponemataceae bacterium]|nr:MAG: PIN domain-containing protein [Treponemataceae bacterium]
MKVYLDNCCYNRPFDDQTDFSVRLEAEAKLYVQELIKEGYIDLVWSSVNDFENNDNPFDEKRERIAAENCTMNDAILQKAVELRRQKLQAKDALHIAAAIVSKCDYFLTTDNKILNKNIAGIKVVNPVVFPQEYTHEKRHIN